MKSCGVGLAGGTHNSSLFSLPGARSLFEAHLESNNMSLEDFHVILEVDNTAAIKNLIRRDIFHAKESPRTVHTARGHSAKKL